MSEIKVKDIRVSPRSLDLKNNAEKSLLEIFSQLQSGSVVRGLVVGSRQDNEFIFHSAFGRFTIKTDLNLTRGDKINLELVRDNNKLSASILSVNNKQQSDKLLNNIEPVLNNKEPIKKDLGDIDIKNVNIIPKNITGNISYLNLSKIDKNSAIFQLLNNIKSDAPQNTVSSTLNSNNTLISQDSKINIGLKLLPNANTKNLPFSLLGEVSGNDKDGNQLIKTNFGMIVSQNTKIPIGQKLNLEITQINNQPIKDMVDHNVTNFLYSANKNWLALKQIAEAVKKNYISKDRANENISEQNANNKAADNLARKQTSVSLPQVGNKTLDKSATQTTEIATRTLNKEAINSAIKEPVLTKSALPDATKQAPSEKTPQTLSLKSDLATTPTRKENISGNLNDTSALIKNAETIALRPGKDIKNRIKNTKESYKTEENTRSENALPEKETPSRNFANQTISNIAGKQDDGINKIIRNFGQFEELSKLSSEAKELKDLILPVIDPQEISDKWHSILIPFYYQKETEYHEFNIQRPQKNILKFTINVELRDNPMQLDGLIIFANQNKALENFDLTIRSKRPLDPEIRTYISNIYNMNQQISNIQGSLSITQSSE